MEPTEKDIIIKKIKEMPAEQVSKVLVFIAGLEAGAKLDRRSTMEKDGEIYIEQ